MNVTFQIGALLNDTDWKQLGSVLGGPSTVVNSVIRHLMLSNVTSYLLEDRYIDRDYSSDYRHFYAQTFKTYDRHCKRIHFFAEDISKLFSLPHWSNRVKALEYTSQRSYCGFCVIRPLANASIGRTALKMRGPEGKDLETVITCRADFRANLMGAELDVCGATFMQQDSRIGACAQIAIWMGARHMHQRYRYNWLSVADITKLASPTTSDESTTLPAGSEFLTSERMIRAVHEMGFQPLCFKGPNIGEQILPYVESGLPVILGLDIPGANIGHAVTVIGRVFSKLDKATSRPIDFISGFIVHDDQAGPYKVIPATQTSAKEVGFAPEDTVLLKTRTGNLEFNIKEHGVFAIALMPIRAFSTARAAEVTAHRRINDAFLKIDLIKAEIQKSGNVNPLLDELIAAHQAGDIVLKTYLTSTDGYRRHIANGTACDALKDVLLGIHLPHFTWITEISSKDSYNNSSAGLRRIYGHSVIDATSSGRDAAGLLILHLPGVIFLRDVNTQSQTAVMIDNDNLYECREKR
ncbi:hypothetical protein [Bradyrhizobium sp. LTSP857]|uniref:hypothetical protein n=1 Tax=Bradyrhizobium sp. LTSP857 TaxID=1619231 RepID=UPI000B22A45F|nr:hypothetical protein [Bradyrhizobium sp. LTSP857]